MPTYLSYLPAIQPGHLPYLPGTEDTTITQTVPPVLGLHSIALRFYQPL